MNELNSFFIATGTNLGDRAENLKIALDLLICEFDFVAKSRVYQSKAVDYLNQPDFYNQVLEFKINNLNSHTVMNTLLSIELKMGRDRLIPKGPRLIDLDLLFFGNLTLRSHFLTLPHPQLFKRSFVVLPLSELPGFDALKANYVFSFDFDNSASPVLD